MFRTPRITASLVRSLTFGTVAVAGTLASTSVLVSCSNENQPEYWVKKLDDQAWRPRAIKRLGQFFEDAMTRANKDREHADVKGLLDKLAVPLTEIYVNNYDLLDENTREELINLLASFRDPRTEPALKKAFEEFGKSGRGGKEVKWASRAVRDMKLKGASADVLAAFKKTKPSTKEGAYYRDLNEALLAVADPSWTNDLIGMVEADFPVVDPKSKDVEAMKEVKDKTYQVITAGQLLGELRAASAVQPLLKVILDPTKQGAANDSLLALTKIGKPAVDETIKLLENKSPELAEFHKKQVQKAQKLSKPPEGDPHVRQAAIVLGGIGHPAAIQPMINAVSKAKEDSERAVLLTALATLPHTPEVTAAFKEGLQKMPKTATVGNSTALQALAEPATSFLDSSFVPILLEKGRELGDDKVGASLLGLAAIKVMEAPQVAAVGSFVKRLGKADGNLGKHLEKVAAGYEGASKLLAACKKDASCYLQEAQKSENQSDKNQLIGLKAIYMTGIYGGAGQAGALVDALGNLPKASLRYAVAQVLDHHLPTGNAGVAKKLEGIIDERKDSMDRSRQQADKPLRDLLYRLQARAR